MQPRSVLLSILIIQMATLAAMIFNIPIARQVLGFLLITFVPGFLILQILRFDNLRIHVLVFLSVGVSIAFLMFLGLLLNTLLPIFGMSAPLSTFPTMVSVSSFVLVSCVILWGRDESSPSLTIPRLKLSRALVIVLLVSIPFLAVTGTEIARIAGNTVVLMLLVILTSLIVLCAFSNKLIPAEIYPLAILAIALFLLFHVSLTSDYLIGADIHAETYFAQTAFANSFWDRTTFHPYNAMISATILPVVYANFLNLDITLVFRIAYPLIYSFVPLILYFAFRKQTGSLVAFLGVFFFMSMDTFYVQMLGLARQMIGELFFALLILLIVDEEIGIVRKRLIFVVLSIALLFSHYSLAYLFIFLALATFSVSSYFKANKLNGERVEVAHARHESANFPDLSKDAKTLHGKMDKIKQAIAESAPGLITGKFVLGYAIATSAWYIFVVPAASRNFADALGYIYNALISNISGPGVSGLMPKAYSLIRQVSQYLFYLLQFFVVIGFIVLIMKRRESQFNPEYAGMSVGSMLLLLMSIFIPNFAATLNVSRMYHISLFCLAPICVIGGMSIVNLMVGIRSRLGFFPKKLDIAALRSIRKAWMTIIAVLLVCLFLFQVGFIYEISGDAPTSISLGISRKNSWTIYMNQLYVDQQEVSAIKWLAQFNNNESRVYADSEGTTYLTSYGLISGKRLGWIEPELSGSYVDISYIFFDRLSVVDNIVIGYSTIWNSTDFSSILNRTNRVYCDGASDIYCGRSTNSVSTPPH